MQGIHKEEAKERRKRKVGKSKSESRKWEKDIETKAGEKKVQKRKNEARENALKGWRNERV